MTTIDVNTLSRNDIDQLNTTPHSLFIGHDLDLAPATYFGTFTAGRLASHNVAITIETHDLTPLDGALLLTYTVSAPGLHHYDMVTTDDVPEGVDIIRKALAKLATPTKPVEWDDVKHLL